MAQPRIPVLSPVPQRAPERDDPPVVLKLLEAQERKALARAQKASRLTPSLAAGCMPVVDAGGARRLGPPAPAVKARIIGHQVELLIRYRHLPTSDSCRPWTVTAVVYAGRPASGSFNNSGAVQTYPVNGPVGRAIVDLPWGGHAPYHLLVSSSTGLGSRSEELRIALACPASGCLPGYRPSLHAWTLPKPVLPIGGITRSQLEASVREVVAQERWPSAITASCPSLRVCLVTQLTPGFPHSPYRERYRIAGQQIEGCWSAIWQGAADPLPYQDAGNGPLELAGCRRWLS